MKIISWNVNGIRAVLKKDFINFVHASNADVICLQETKATAEQVELTLDDYPYKFWNSAEKKGYSGTAIFSKQEPISWFNNIGVDEHDKEGRVCVCEYNNFYLVNVYVPNSKRGLLRLDYRTQQWDVAFLAFLKNLEKKKPVIFCGDLNVAHKEIDLANPKTNENNAGFTIQERESFDKFISAGFVDTFRLFTKEGGHYSWWSYMANSREKNIGWRIDYFMVSESIVQAVKKSYILPDVFGSDHAPIALEIAF